MSPSIDPDSVQTMPKPSAHRKSTGGIVGKFILACVALALVILCFLPSLASWIATSPEAVAWVSGQPAGAIEVGAASFPWQGPMCLSNVVVHAPDGRPIANVKTMTSERSLWNLLTQPLGPLKLHFDGIRVAVPLPRPGEPRGRLDLSEFTETLQNFKLPHPAQAMEVSITHGAIDFQNPEREPIESWSNISATYRYESNNPQKQEVSIVLPAEEKRGSGEMTLQGTWTCENNPQRTEIFSLQGHGERVSLKVVELWLEKFLGPDHGLSSCTGELAATFQRDLNSGWELTGSAHFDENQFLPDLTIGQVAYQAPADAKAELEVEGRYSKPDDQLAVPRLHFTADDAALDLKGSVKDLSGQQVLNVLAEVQTPGPAILDLLPRQLREQIQIEGTKFSEISITGSLLPLGGTTQPLTYSMIASWQKAAAYGLESENGQLRITYRNGQVHTDQLNVPLSGGRLMQLPVLDLRTDPPTLQFQEGVILENVMLSEEVCRGWLKYVSPTLANATSADGRLSLAMKKGKLIVGAPEKSTLNGVLTIQDGRVRPGPLALDILQNVTGIQRMINPQAGDLGGKTWLNMKQETVPFQMAEGRVYHQNFGANVGDLRLTTNGSVGLDQTLAIQMQLALPEKWVQNDRPLLRALSGEAFALQIEGTFSEPKIDASALADAGKEIGIKAGVGLLEKIIERRRQRNR